MKLVSTTLIAAALLAGGSAHAIPLPPFDPGGSAAGIGWNGNAVLSFSPNLIGFVNASQTTVSPLSPASVTATKSSTNERYYRSAAVDAPIQSGTADFDGTTVSLKSVSANGGVLLTAEEEGYVTTGGSLSLTNWRIDLDTKRVYVSMVGANGVGTIDNLHMWNVSAVSGQTSFAAYSGVNTLTNEFTGLAITADAFNLMSVSLGLTKEGRDVMSTVTNFGKISTVASAVPEPSTFVFAGLGLVLMALASRRNRSGSGSLRP